MYTNADVAKRRNQCTGTTSPKPMKLGMARRQTLSKEEYKKLRAENACFYCRKPHAGHVVRDCPLKRKRL